MISLRDMEIKHPDLLDKTEAFLAKRDGIDKVRLQTPLTEDNFGVSALDEDTTT